MANSYKQCTQSKRRDKVKICESKNSVLSKMPWTCPGLEVLYGW